MKQPFPREIIYISPESYIFNLSIYVSFFSLELREIFLSTSIRSFERKNTLIFPLEPHFSFHHLDRQIDRITCLRVTKRNAKRRDRFIKEGERNIVAWWCNRGRKPRATPCLAESADGQRPMGKRGTFVPRTACVRYPFAGLVPLPNLWSRFWSRSITEPGSRISCMCVRECTPVSTTFGSLSLVTGSSGFGHKVVDPFWKRGSVYGLETSRSLEGGCFWHCLGLVILFFFFFLLHFRFRKGILRPERLWFSMRVFFFFFL